MKVSVFLKYPHHVLITFILQSQIINHNIYINSSSHDPQWVSYRYLDKRKSPINGLFTPFMKLCLLFKLANKILLLYFLVLVLWFYLVLYVFNCPKSIGCTERCYQIVIMIVLSIIFSLKRLKQLLAIHLTLQQSVLE